MLRQTEDRRSLPRCSGVDDCALLPWGNYVASTTQQPIIGNSRDTGVASIFTCRIKDADGQLGSFCGQDIHSANYAS